MQKKLHYYLISGKIIYEDVAQEGLISVPQSGILIIEKNRIRAYELGKAQQNLQIQFFTKMDDVNIPIRDVLLDSLSYLGHMTQEEFGSKPEEMVPIQMDPFEKAN